MTCMHESSLELSADPSSVAQARRHLHDQLVAWDVEGFDWMAVQVLSELVTNATLHARSGCTVRLAHEGDSLLMSVTDSSPVLPRPRHYGTEATTGRGLALVDALSTGWGVQESPPGKTVWCRIARDDAGGRWDDLGEDGQDGPARPGRAGRPAAGEPGGVLSTVRADASAWADRGPTAVAATPRQLAA